jgi:hypothetical protein
MLDIIDNETLEVARAIILTGKQMNDLTQLWISFRLGVSVEQLQKDGYFLEL